MAGLPAGDSIILEEEVDPAYEPTHDEVLEYAKWLGMDCDVDSDLLYVGSRHRCRLAPVNPLCEH